MSTNDDSLHPDLTEQDEVADRNGVMVAASVVSTEGAQINETAELKPPSSPIPADEFTDQTKLWRACLKAE